MTLLEQDPLASEWSTRPPQGASARSICEELAQYDIGELPAWLLPYLAAAAIELTSIVGTTWRVTADDPVVVLLRTIARIAIADPGAGGPHCDRLQMAMHLR